jgi:hypothetical protein
MGGVLARSLFNALTLKIELNHINEAMLDKKTLLIFVIITLSLSSNVKEIKNCFFLYRVSEDLVQQNDF